MSKLKLNKETKDIKPSLFLVTLKAEDKTKREMQLHNSFTVAYMSEEAIDIAIHTLKTKDIKIYEYGLALGGWVYMQHHALGADMLEQMFNEAGEITKSIKEANLTKKKNDLMAAILDTKDVNLLHENISIFTDAEKNYLHEKLTK